VTFVRPSRGGWSDKPSAVRSLNLPNDFIALHIPSLVFEGLVGHSDKITDSPKPPLGTDFFPWFRADSIRRTSEAVAFVDSSVTVAEGSNRSANREVLLRAHLFESNVSGPLDPFAQFDQLGGVIHCSSNHDFLIGMFHEKPSVLIAVRVD
jgi:hypothetical protein